MPSNQTQVVPGRPPIRQWNAFSPAARKVAAAAACCAIAAAFTGCGKSEPQGPAPVSTTAIPGPPDELQAATRLITGIASNDPAAFSAIDPDHFIQHDLSIGDGLLGLKEYAASLPPNSTKITPVRMFRDGDTVVVQSTVDSATPQVAFDIYRFDRGKIIEHWDNLQNRPAGPNPSGHTMTDGPTTVETGDTDAAKSLAKKFVTDVLIGGKLDGYDAFFSGDKYIQHDPGGTDGSGPLKSALASLAASNTPVGYTTVRRVLGQGNFVLVMSDGTPAGKPTAYYDLFRIENGKLAEHWSTVQLIPPREAWKNSDGKF